MDRLLEWQRDLVDKLGVTMHELQEEPLPAEEELDKLKSHLEVLQAERDKRAEIFLNTQVEIKDIMGLYNPYFLTYLVGNIIINVQVWMEVCYSSKQ